MEDFEAPTSHIVAVKKTIVQHLLENEQKKDVKLQDELSRENKYTKSLLCTSSSAGGLTTLREFQKVMEKDIKRSELQKAGLTAQEQELYFKFREDSSLPNTQSFQDRLVVVKEKIEDYFKTNEHHEVKLQHPMDSLKEMQKTFFDDLEDIPSLRKRRKMMIKEEKKLEKILKSPINTDSVPTVARSSKSKWDQR